MARPPVDAAARTLCVAASRGLARSRPACRRDGHRELRRRRTLRRVAAAQSGCDDHLQHERPARRGRDASGLAGRASPRCVGLRSDPGSGRSDARRPAGCEGRAHSAWTRQDGVRRSGHRLAVRRYTTQCGAGGGYDARPAAARATRRRAAGYRHSLFRAGRTGGRVSSPEHRRPRRSRFRRAGAVYRARRCRSSALRTTRRAGLSGAVEPQEPAICLLRPARGRARLRRCGSAAGLWLRSARPGERGACAECRLGDALPCSRPGGARSHPRLGCGGRDDARPRDQRCADGMAVHRP